MLCLPFSSAIQTSSVTAEPCGAGRMEARHWQQQEVVRQRLPDTFTCVLLPMDTSLLGTPAIESKNMNWGHAAMWNANRTCSWTWHRRNWIICHTCIKFWREGNQMQVNYFGERKHLKASTYFRTKSLFHVQVIAQIYNIIIFHFRSELLYSYLSHSLITSVWSLLF